ncbi:MAG: aldehyde dehydrogenase family protein [Bdellovibrionales bacterium]|nr:aldehyde dehydrogenase family protein [Bdellovibrionales bacterium]
MNRLITKDPYTQKVTGEFIYDNFDSVSQKVQKLKNLQKDWTRLSPHQRLEYVKSALSYFEENRQQIAKDICEQMGRPLHQATGEVNGLLERANWMCHIALDSLAPDKLTDKEGFVREIHHVPYGLIFVIAAWNYPLLITINSIIPALISGNVILLKHSNMTPKLGEHFQKAFGKLGDFKNLVQNLVSDHSLTGEIIESLPIDHVIFTGSVKGGHEILKYCQKRFITPLLELGGKDAGYVHKDANLLLAAETLVDGAMFNTGQSCCGIERVYVHEAVADEFIKRAEEIIENYKLGDPKNESTNMGPVAKVSGVDEMNTQVKEAQDLGAQVLCGGKSEKIDQAVFFQPTLIIKTNNQMRIMQEENFGPILPIMKVKNIDEAIALINDNDYGLTASIFTSDEHTADFFFENVDAGTIFMNRCDYLDPALPWTGYKNSGAGGSSLSKYGFYGVTKRKAKHFKVKL